MHQRSAWDVWLWRQLLIQQKAKRSNVALHRQRMCHVIPCHILISIMQSHHMPAIVCTFSSFPALTFTDIASSSMEVLRGRVVRQRSARIVHSRHVLSCIGPAVPQSSWQMRTTDGKRYSKHLKTQHLVTLHISFVTLSYQNCINLWCFLERPLRASSVPGVLQHGHLLQQSALE